MTIDITQYTLEELANALYCNMDSLGFSKGTDKSKWREPVMAEKMGHTAHPKISAGKGKSEYGSDATTPTGFGEYKTAILKDLDLRNLLGKVRNAKTGAKFTPYSVTGVYNGYNSNYETASVEYAKIEHYYGLFYKEECVLIIKVNTDYVMEQLNKNYDRYAERVVAGEKVTTNCNSVTVNLRDTHLYTVVYKNQEFYDSQR